MRTVSIMKLYFSHFGFIIWLFWKKTWNLIIQILKKLNIRKAQILFEFENTW